jgi:hypothetical protein
MNPAQSLPLFSHSIRGRGAYTLIPTQLCPLAMHASSPFNSVTCLYMQLTFEKKPLDRCVRYFSSSRAGVVSIGFQERPNKLRSKKEKKERKEEKGSQQSGVAWSGMGILRVIHAN